MNDGGGPGGPSPSSCLAGGQSWLIGPACGGGPAQRAAAIRALSGERPSSPLAPHFGFAAFSCHVGHAKPAPEIFLACLSKLEVAPAECVFVGDGGSDELAAAGRLGITAVQYTGLVRRISGSPGEPKPGAHFVIDSFDELHPRG